MPSYSRSPNEHPQTDSIKPFSRSNSRITAPTPTPLHRLEDLAPKVLGDVGHIADGVAVGQKVPAAGAVAVVVEPGAKDEVGCNAKEEAIVAY
jgi:hypothetical protein